MSFLDEFQFPDELSISPQLLISKALFIDLARQIIYLIVLHIYIDLKINAVACQLLRLLANENDGDAFLGLQIMKIPQGSRASGPPSLAPPLSGT